jgi:hypothetical protein
MSSAARSKEKQPPSLDPSLQNKLVAKFGPKCLRDEMEFLLVIEPLYRHVPGNSIDGKVSTMSATEHHIMLHLWPAWWSNGAQPWPSIAEMATRLQKSMRQIRRILTSLEQKGFLAREELYGQDGRQRANRCDITPFLQRIADMGENKTEVATSSSQSKVREVDHD